MTILIGFRFDNGVIIAVDKKTSDLNISGEDLGTHTLTKKITTIQRSMLMATAGLGIGNNLRDLMRVILDYRQEINVQEAMEYISSTLQHTYNLFRKVNPEIQYNDLVALVGGYDKEKKKSFLYRFSNLNNFIPTLSQQLIIESPSDEITSSIRNHIAKNINTVNDALELAPILAQAIRNINSPSVSKETFVRLKHFDGEDTFFTETYEYDKNGKDISKEKPVTPK